MVDRLGELVIDKGEYAYLPHVLLPPNAKMPPDAPPAENAMWTADGCRSLIQGLGQYYKVSHYEPARVLARKLVRYLLHDAKFHYYSDKGEFIDGDPKTPSGHFHTHSLTLLSLLEYAIATDDREVMQHVQRCFEWAKSRAADSSTLIGWFPEVIKPKVYVSETCCIADMIGLGIKLSAAGVGDYWNDVERWTRNNFVEAQLTKTDWVARVAEKLPPAKPLTDDQTADHVAERNLGAFACYTMGNDYGITGVGDWMNESGVVICCVGNAARSLYYAWENILSCKDGRLEINMLLKPRLAVGRHRQLYPIRGTG